MGHAVTKPWEFTVKMSSCDFTKGPKDENPNFRGFSCRKTIPPKTHDIQPENLKTYRLKTQVPKPWKKKTNQLTETAKRRVLVDSMSGFGAYDLDMNLGEAFVLSPENLWCYDNWGDESFQYTPISQTVHVCE